MANYLFYLDTVVEVGVVLAIGTNSDSGGRASKVLKVFHDIVEELVA